MKSLLLTVACLAACTLSASAGADSGPEPSPVPVAPRPDAGVHEQPLVDPRKVRAKLVLSTVLRAEGPSEQWTFRAVCRSGGYPPTGLDENNTYAKWTPTADLKMTVTNPALLGQFHPGEEFTVEFTPAPKVASAAPAVD